MTDCKEIPLTQGRVAIVDAQDYDLVAQHNWCFSGGYALRRVTTSDGKKRVILMHRLIMRAPHGLDVDHIDCDGLNNRRCNMRLASRSENMRNARKTKANTSGFKGVSLERGRSGWRADIRLSGRKKYLGRYQTPIQAATAYDEAARNEQGVFARINFPDEGENSA